MKKLVPLPFFFLLAGLAFFSWLARSKLARFTTTLAMQTDAMVITNYYIPKRIILKTDPGESNLILPRFNSPTPMFGSLFIGNSSDSLVTLALDESERDGLSLLYVDKNNNEDLTDDGDPNWDDDKNGYWSKEELIDVHYKDEGQSAAVPYPVQFYRYKNRRRESIVAFRNGYREGYIALQDSAYKIALLDDDLNGLFDDLANGAMIVDLNRDDHLDGHTDSEEYFPLSSAFRVGRTSYRVLEVTPSGDRLTLTLADTLAPENVSLKPGQPAPDFQAYTLDGQFLTLAQLRDKVVLLDFWATWCKPWESEVAYLKRNYWRQRSQGFEIIGLNLDYDLDTLKEYLQTHKIDWPQVSEGTGWDMSVVQTYNVQAIPKNFLLDRNGVIRYKDVHGKNLGAKIYELLNEP